jgi:hypothetical protein
MGKPLRYIYYTAAGTLECQRTEDQIRDHPAYRAVVKPAEGRPRLAGALHFIVQEMLEEAQGKEWFRIVDNSSNITTLRPGAIYGFRVLEPLGGSTEEPVIGFRPRQGPQA